MVDSRESARRSDSPLRDFRNEEGHAEKLPGAEGHSRGPSRHFAGDGGTSWKRGCPSAVESGRQGDVSEVKEHYWGGGAKVFLWRKRERSRDSFAWRRGLS